MNISAASSSWLAMAPIRRVFLAALLACLPGGVLLIEAHNLAVLTEPVAVDEAALIAEITTRYASLTGFSAAFVQEIRSPSYDTVVQTGELRAQPPDRLRWWMTGEGGGKLACDGETLWAWPSDDAVIYQITDPEPEDTAFTPLSDLADLTGRFVVVDLLVSPSDIVLSLRRRSAPEAVTMVLERDSLALRSVRREDAYGQIVLLRLSEVVLDAEVSGFTMQVPDGIASWSLD
ncbi:MAG: outer membrane lipoprotein-sorting protein [Myxococcota bacterium]